MELRYEPFDPEISTDPFRHYAALREHAPSELAHNYHADRRTGRRRLAAMLGIANDRFCGLGPDWSAGATPS